ncbi:hypothetical protein GLOTRDRAFT_127974 [Gloeophyllum trabeum ATCC 11539]|uniref:Uncharacterized protein n=1 Tax=Gloeophyllum trabeum (strain ATCC 11539 / FP-39264 / Madison 617) TaxID=670483 RepID=S7QDX0_GLOTA|nr:uncharacterized protein GLOTRDRAFT_127974 [Gloeophyllum trabeum ATCC 11539]EPQ57617.1 hypothetical protein GLOTRDRAFT_127974 [Gloeophyllum trabeum ATCC 11539]
MRTIFALFTLVVSVMSAVAVPAPVQPRADKGVLFEEHVHQSIRSPGDDVRHSYIKP